MERSSLGRSPPDQSVSHMGKGSPWRLVWAQISKRSSTGDEITAFRESAVSAIRRSRNSRYGSAPPPRSATWLSASSIRPSICIPQAAGRAADTPNKPARNQETTHRLLPPSPCNPRAAKYVGTAQRARKSGESASSASTTQSPSREGNQSSPLPAGREFIPGSWASGRRTWPPVRSGLTSWV